MCKTGLGCRDQLQELVVMARTAKAAGEDVSIIVHVRTSHAGLSTLLQIEIWHACEGSRPRHPATRPPPLRLAGAPVAIPDAELRWPAIGLEATPRVHKRTTQDQMSCAHADLASTNSLLKRAA